MMGVERIHAYPNHYILYRGDTFKGLDKYLVCSASRYKNNAGYCGGDNKGPGNGNKRKRKGAMNSVASIEPAYTTLGISEKRSRIPAMVMLYLRVADRLRHFFSNPKDAELIAGGIQISARRATESFNIQLMLASGRSSMSSIIWNLERTRGIFGLH
jgi:hypothetical protein